MTVRRKFAVGVVAITLMSTVLAGCQLGKVGGRCKGGDFGRDATHILVCQKGRWVRGMSFLEFVSRMREQQRAPLDGIVQVASGAAFNCALRNDGTVLCWGGNLFGSLGAGAKGATTIIRENPEPVVGITGATAIALNEMTACAIVAGGAVMCWGANDSGQAGSAGDWSLDTPQALPGISGATAITLGAAHGCAVIAGGEVRCWGSNGWGQVGDGSYIDRSGPTAVADLAGAAAVTAGANHTCALLIDGDVVCWGRNDAGQLGDGVRGDDARPWFDDVVGLGGRATSIAATDHTTCATLVDGTVRCWGSWENGVLGTNASDDAHSPVTLTMIAGATQVAGGIGNTFCALTGGGAGTCWGANSRGQIGDTTTTDRPTPTGVVGLAGATQLAVGNGQSCARMANATVQCWGDNQLGQVDPNRGSTVVTPATVTALPAA